MSRHAAVWLDHSEAHLYEITPDDYRRSTVKAHGDARQHRKAGTVGDGRSHDETFFHAVAQGLTDAQEIYVCGPGSAKIEFQKHVEKHDRQVARRIVKMETVDHPSDGQIAAQARRFFKAFERITPLNGRSG